MVGRLVEHPRDRASLNRAQPRRGRWALGAHVVSERPGDREVAAHGVSCVQALAQRGKPARAEVDGVERQQVVGHVREGALQVVTYWVQGRSRYARRRVGCGDLCERVADERVLIDPHPPRLRSELRAA